MSNAREIGDQHNLTAFRDLLRYIAMQRQGDIMTAHAITGRRFHRDDRIHFMTGPRGRRRGGRPFPYGPGQAFGRRAGRGDIRAAILALLTQEPMHGYQIIQELAERTGGVWRPSPGSVYPTLQQLEDEELVRETSSESGKRVYELTDAGREQAAGAPAPWTAVAGESESELMTLRDLAHQVLAATRQVAHAGTAAQIEAAQAVLRDARKALYRLLAEDEDAS
jgi:DNA-binding PadR family transcriptional regulator